MCFSSGSKKQNKFFFSVSVNKFKNSLKLRPGEMIPRTTFSSRPVLCETTLTQIKD